MQNTSIISLKRRLLAVFVLVSFCFLGVIVRLGYLQLIKGEWLQVRAIDQWTRDLPLNAIRGSIFDCNGVTLATSYSSYDVYVRPSMVKDERAVAHILSDALGVDFEKVYSKVIDRYVSEALIKLQVSKDKVSEIKASGLSGILFSENNSRVYPHNSMLTQVLGFTTIDNVGQAGLEAYYDKYLTGINGYIVEESDVKGVTIDNTLTTYMPSIPGMNLNLTIDTNIQRFTENALQKLYIEQKPKKASAIVMNPNTGEIVAMATLPNFDLNNVPRNDVSVLMETVKNINIVDVYEPGSTFKCITMANAIENGVASLSDTFFDPGYRMVDGEKIKCWKLTGHGMQTLSEGLCNSCNSVFVDLALRLGKEGIYEMFEKFGFGVQTGIDFYGESSGIIMDSSVSKTVDIARMGFGQAVAVTPIQQISAICSIVNGGKLYKPYFVKSIEDSMGNIISKTEPTVVARTISENTSDIMRIMMEDVIKQYSGYYSYIPGYRVSGKTGTTQKYADGKISGEYIASFVGAFPADKPDYVILIIADEPGGDSYYGSIVATPYAKLIIEDIIKYKNYAPANPKELENGGVFEYIDMPHLMGLNIYEALNILDGIGLQVEIEGSGNVVLDQFPYAGVIVVKNGIVVVKT
ncbi:MAG: stage V sporulation protein D [Clostridiales bacterium]|nr:stage V sporulation protein D [Clostridiales bacterium]